MKLYLYSSEVDYAKLRLIIISKEYKDGWKLLLSIVKWSISNTCMLENENLFHLRGGIYTT